MKVLFVIPSYEPAWAFGGTVTATSQLCRALASQGVDVSVYTTDADGRGRHLGVPLNEPIDLGGVEVRYFYCNIGLRRAFYSRDLSRKLKETINDFDLIHVSSIWQWHQVAVSRICLRYRKPYIVTPHNSLSSLSMRLSNNLKKRIYWLLWGRDTIQKATGLHFLCDGERRSSVGNTFNVPSFVVPNGMDTSLCSRNDRTKLRKAHGFQDQDMVALFVGRIHPDKKLDLVIKGLASMRDKAHFKLLVVGPFVDENYRRYLVKLIKELNVENNLILKGPIEHNKINIFYALADLLVLVSKFEGVSMTSIEALSSGVPIIISKGVANWEEIVQDGAGILINDDPESVTRIFTEIYKGDINIQDLSLNARKSAEKRYDTEKTASLMMRAYNDILTSRKSPELQWN